MIKIGIIGAGRIGKVHTESICNYVRNAHIKTVADPVMNETTEKWLLSMGVEMLLIGIKRLCSSILNDAKAAALGETNHGTQE